MMTFTEHELRAYLDGDLDDARAQEVEAALAVDHNLEDRMMALDSLAPFVGAAIDYLPKPTSDQITSWTQQTPAEPRRWLSVAAGVMLGVVGMGAAAWLMPQPTPDWRSAVASYQALYGPETLEPLQFSEADLRGQMAQAEARIGAEGLYDLVTGLEGLQLLRSQILSHEGAPLIQIVFATDAGEPVALCLMRADGSQRAGVEDVSSRSGLASLAFETTGHNWILIGTEDPTFIAAAGAQLHKRLGIGA